MVQRSGQVPDFSLPWFLNLFPSVLMDSCLLTRLPVVNQQPWLTVTFINVSHYWTLGWNLERHPGLETISLLLKVKATCLKSKPANPDSLRTDLSIALACSLPLAFLFPSSTYFTTEWAFHCNGYLLVLPNHCPFWYYHPFFLWRISAPPNLSPCSFGGGGLSSLTLLQESVIRDWPVSPKFMQGWTHPFRLLRQKAGTFAKTIGTEAHLFLQRF